MKEYRVKVYPDMTEWRNLAGFFHREGGPAIEQKNGTKFWYIDGNRHREDGPAVEYASGHKEWWLDGCRISEKEFNKIMSKDPWNGKTVEIDSKKYRLELLNEENI